MRAKQFEAEDGSVTMIFVAMMATLLVVTVAATTFGRLVIAQSNLQNAVDASALAGASILLSSPDQACKTSARIAELNHLEVTSCTMSDFDVRLSARKALHIMGTNIELTARARAGAT